MSHRTKPARTLAFAAAGFALMSLVASGCTSGDGTCTPITCEDASAGCGVISDHCGGNIACGNCDAPQRCDVVTNQCGCTPQTSPCDGKCGKLIDDCGMPADCGGCAAGLNCGGDGANVCGAGTCVPSSCAAQGRNCGSIADGCGELLVCGTCTAPQTCGGGGAPNTCGCKAITCGELGKDCGSIADGCGAMIDCGTCSGDKTCGGGAVSNVCGSPSAAGAVTLAWDPVTSYVNGAAIPPGKLGGYHVHYGVAAGQYGPPVDVGDAVTHAVAGLSSGATYYFAVSAYDADGNESALSTEVSKTLE